ncbi:MAG: hypothetical protein AAGC81_20005, partial [Pseudomonadota bacterium]
GSPIGPVLEIEGAIHGRYRIMRYFYLVGFLLIGCSPDELASRTDLTPPACSELDLVVSVDTVMHRDSKGRFNGIFFDDQTELDLRGARLLAFGPIEEVSYESDDEFYAETRVCGVEAYAEDGSSRQINIIISKAFLPGYFGGGTSVGLTGCAPPPGELVCTNFSRSDRGYPRSRTRVMTSS